MNRLTVLALLLAPLFARAAEPPKTRVDPVTDTLHGVDITDPYRWLEEQKSPATRAWIAEQQKYANSVLAPLPGRAAIQKRLGELLRTDFMSTPSVHGGRWFFSKRAADQDLPVFYVRSGPDGKDEVLLDANTLSEDKAVSASTIDISEDGKIWAYGLRTGGEDEVEVHFRDVDTKKDFPLVLPRARYAGVQLTADKTELYIARMTKEGPRVAFRPFAKDGAEKPIFGEAYGPDKIITASIPEGGKYLLLTVLYGSAATKSEVYVKDLKNAGPITPIVNDVNARFSGQIGGDTLFLQTNWNAPNNKIVAVDLKKPARENWKEVAPETKNVLQSFAAIGGNLYVTYLENAVTRLELVKVRDAQKLTLVMGAPIAKNQPFATIGISGRWDSPDFFFTYTSFVQPPNLSYYQNINGGSQISRIWTANVPLKPDDFDVKQVRFKSKDGAEIPMFVVHKKGLKLDGANPTFLTGYGGFNLSRTPAFAASIALWCEHGGVFALPSLRGGGEFGEAWHQAGMRDKKQNVFDDFIGAAEWLIQEKYTSPEKLAIAGGSNGGLLVGAALTQRPELFRAVVCSVPLLDMVRFHKFLVARFWVPEYGSSEDPEQFKYIHAYSPYHRVKPGTKYPAVLFVTGDADTRVDPLHARKMCALLQASTASGPDRPVLLHYDTKAGHSAGKPVSKQIEDLTDEYAFLFWQLGMK